MTGVQTCALPIYVARTAGRIRETHQWLGWTPTTDLASGLRQQVAWHRLERSARTAASGAEAAFAVDTGGLR